MDAVTRRLLEGGGGIMTRRTRRTRWALARLILVVVVGLPAAIAAAVLIFTHGG